jgi:hypothetical protein
MLSLTQFNLDEFEGDILLLKDQGNTQSIARGIRTIELEDHDVGG